MSPGLRSDPAYSLESGRQASVSETYPCRHRLAKHFLFRGLRVANFLYVQIVSGTRSLTSDRNRLTAGDVISVLHPTRCACPRRDPRRLPRDAQ